MVNTYAIQINGSTELLLSGELRDNFNRLGPGGVFTVLNVGPGKLAQKGDKVFLIALPDAPATTARNLDARKEQNRRKGDF